MFLMAKAREPIDDLIDAYLLHQRQVSALEKTVQLRSLEGVRTVRIEFEPASYWFRREPTDIGKIVRVRVCRCLLD
jgi:hypothetical protein